MRESYTGVGEALVNKIRETPAVQERDESQEQDHRKGYILRWLRNRNEGKNPPQNRSYDEKPQN